MYTDTVYQYTPGKQNISKSGTIHVKTLNQYHPDEESNKIC